MQYTWTFIVVAVWPELQVEQLRHVTGQPLSSQE